MKLSPTQRQDLRDATAGKPNPTGPRRFVRLFKPQFAALVAAGTKRQTIRPLPVRIPRRDDLLSLRVWSGKPYRSKQITIRGARVLEVKVVHLERDWMMMQPPEGSLLQIAGAVTICLDGADADRFARADGFESYADMADWFDRTHGLPFDGIAVFW